MSFRLLNEKDSDFYEQINIYYLNNNGSKNIVNEKYVTKKIIIIPVKYKYLFLVSLFFHDNMISLVNLEQNFDNLADLNIENYKAYNLDELQFLVYNRFLLVFYYKDLWECDVYTIFSENNNEFFQKIETRQIYFNIKEKNCQFSICKVKEDVLLYYCCLKENKLIIDSKKVSTSLASKEIENTSDNKENEILNLTEGNCALNYYYHAFKKFPSIGALQ